MSGSRWEVERALRTSGLPAQARLVALILLTFADAATAVIPAEFNPSLTALAACTGLGRSTVARALNILESSGWVIRTRPDPERARSEGAPTQYRLCIPASPRAGLVPERDYPGSATAGLPVVPERDWSSPAAGPNQNSKKPKPEQKRSAKADPYLHLPGFAEFWTAYPRKTAKRQAANAYRAALNRAGDRQLLIKGALTYRDAADRDPKYTKHPATWLNGDCWLDESEPGRGHRGREAGRRVAAQLAELRNGLPR